MYAKKFDCPECGNSLSDVARKCKCGWTKLEDEKNYDPRCIFVFNGKRCPLPGTISSSTQKSNDWRCEYHFQTIGMMLESSKLIDFIEKNFNEIIHFRKHYSTNSKNCERCIGLLDLEDVFNGRQKRSSQVKKNSELKIVGRLDHLKMSDEARQLEKKLDAMQQDKYLQNPKIAHDFFEEACVHEEFYGTEFKDL